MTKRTMAQKTMQEYNRLFGMYLVSDHNCDPDQWLLWNKVSNENQRQSNTDTS